MVLWMIQAPETVLGGRERGRLCASFTILVTVVHAGSGMLST